MHGSGGFANLAPPLPPVSPDWAPTGVYGGAFHQSHAAVSGIVSHSGSCGNPLHQHTHTVVGEHGNWGIGCTCFAF